MKYYMLKVFVLITFKWSFGQQTGDTINTLQQDFKTVKFKLDKAAIIEKDIIVFSPSKSNKINGLNINYWYNESNAIMTNGLELGLSPVSVFFPFLTIVHSIPPFVHDPPSYNRNYVDRMVFDKVNGIRFGIAFLDPAIVNGLELNLTGGFDTKVNGLSISSVINKHMMVNGVDIAILGNFDAQVNGIQIGLFNKCDNLKGIQLGLWNKNNKRSLPFINWNFK